MYGDLSLCDRNCDVKDFVLFQPLDGMQAVVNQIKQYSAKVIIVDSAAAFLPDLRLERDAGVCCLCYFDIKDHVERFTCTQRKPGNAGKIDLRARQHGKRLVRFAVLF